jgi:hypothetical protein
MENNKINNLNILCNNPLKYEYLLNDSKEKKVIKSFSYYIFTNILFFILKNLNNYNFFIIFQN